MILAPVGDEFDHVWADDSSNDDRLSTIGGILLTAAVGPSQMGSKRPQWSFDGPGAHGFDGKEEDKGDYPPLRFPKAVNRIIRPGWLFANCQWDRDC